MSIAAASPQATPTAVYRTLISGKRGATEAREPGLDLSIGWTGKFPDPVPVIVLGGQELGTTDFSLTRHGTTLTIAIDLLADADLVCGDGRAMYLKAEAVIDGTGQRFTGKVLASCADRNLDAEPYTWTGAVTVSAQEHRGGKRGT
ncbi:hypothetical protein [Streptomyces violascens]|uniref:Uncharacterized protein n=1 Tax=Streptomyces violascens TaxID=67381 RepID=A0ABQ3QRQ8_9ACTN|nr:hypothetical protein [Streptomyces violascens]GHI39961.1 hypothetical protein Sviol_43690 [Streptomyces violascens]